MRPPLFASLLMLACSSNASEPNNTPDTGTTGPALTYHENVEAIVQEKCQSCHRPGGMGPFSLLTYDDVKKRAALVADQVKTRSMPPWGAFETEECKPRHKIYKDLGVPQQDVDTIARWVEQGAQRGDPSKAPAPKTFTDSKLEGVTHSGTIAEHAVMPSNKDEHICFPIDPGFTEDTFIDGIAVTPGNTNVVHHVLVYGDPNNEAAGKAGSLGYYPCFGGPGVSNTMVLTGWVPGSEPTNYPAGVAMKIPKGLKAVVQMHYHPSGTAQNDSTKVEFRVAKTTPAWEARVQLIGNARTAPQLLAGPSDPSTGVQFLIPANATAHTEEMVFTMPTLPVDIRIAGVTAHMHWAGTDMKVDIERPAPTATDPAKECLIQTPKYDFNWQRGYAYNATVDQLPRLFTKDKLRIRCTYNNSMSNRHVANALVEQKLSEPQPITMGEDTLDEMCLGAFALYVKL
jgi:hypothetical protein